MSTAITATPPTGPGPRRHALGLPSGSVRATHILGIVALVCGLLFVPPDRNVHVPPYLVYLMFLGLGHYFATRQSAPAAPDEGFMAHPPLYLPSGTIRFLLFAMLAGTIGYLLYADPEKLRLNFEASLDEMKAQPYMLLVILGAFFLGVVVRAIVGRKNPPQAWQDFEAWLSLVSLLGLLAATIIHLVIGASIADRLSLPIGEGILGAGIAFYFGARS